MKHMTTFIMSMTVSACIFSAGQFVTATDTKLFAGGKTTIDGCTVTGELIRKDDGIYARFLAKNETDSEATMSFNYAANRITGRMAMSRMGPRPETIKSDKCEITMSAGESKSIDVLMKEETRPALELKTDEKTAKSALTLSPDSWSLIVSKEPIKAAAGWGALTPGRSRGNINLKKGTAVLDSGAVVESVAKPESTAKNG